MPCSIWDQADQLRIERCEQDSLGDKPTQHAIESLTDCEGLRPPALTAEKFVLTANSKLPPAEPVYSALFSHTTLTNLLL
jgi:hypothetical protein